MSNLVLQFRSRSVLSYFKRQGKSKYRSQARQQSISNLAKQQTYSGMVTEGSQKRLTRALENLLQIAQPKPLPVTSYEPFGLHTRAKTKEYMFKVNFVTLTLYSFGKQVPGKEGHKKCLEPLLRWLRGKGMTAYVWKAELQMNREDCHQLHYHLTTDVYVDCFELRDKWNELQRKAGYLDYYFEKFGDWDANSTDVHATHNKKNLIGYLKKKIVRYSDKKKYQHLRSQYMIKAEMAKAVQNKETIEGKVWDCSQNVKVSYFEVANFSDVTKTLAAAAYRGEIERKTFERCIVFELKGNHRSCAADYLPPRERFLYYERLKEMRRPEGIRGDIRIFSTS